MTRRRWLGTLAAAALARVGRGQTAAGARLYTHSFQGGSLAAFDLERERIAWTLPLADKTGMAGVAASPDGRTVFVADGAGPDRLRIVDAATGKAAAEVAFHDRVQSLGGAPSVHLARSGRLLLLKTLHLEDAAAGVLLFDPQRRMFLPVGLRGRSCGAPEFASSESGALFGACPGTVQRWQPHRGVAADPPATGEVHTELWEVTAATATANGEDVYVLEAFRPEGPWRLAHWHTAGAQVENRDLRTLLPQAGADASGRQAWMEVSPDGTTLAIAQGKYVWFLERATLRFRRIAALAESATGLAFLPGGAEIARLDGSEPAWFLFRVASGAVRRIPFTGAAGSVRPWHFVAAPKP
jgi:hypothetical protein